MLSSAEKESEPNAELKPAAAPAAKNTTFTFRHKGFSIQGAIFKFNNFTHEPELCLTLGDYQAALAFKDVARAFELPNSDPDIILLRTVERSLRYVAEIRPGDSIPNEILDGSASWKIEARHYQVAYTRLLMQLMKWLSEGGAEIASLTELMSQLEQAETKERINHAFEQAAQHLGLKDHGKERITDMIEQMAGELAYIEALREKIAGYVAIGRKLQVLAKPYKDEKVTAQSIDRILALTNPIFRHMREQMRVVETRTIDIMNTLSSLAATIGFVREVRDQMRGFVLLWENLDQEWAGAPRERGQVTDHLIQKTYRFVASHYLTGQNWTAR